MNGDQNRGLTRRRLLTAVGTGATVAAAGCTAPTANDAPESPTGRLEQFDKYPRVAVGSVDELAEGDVSTFTYPLDGQENFLTRLSESAWDGVGSDDGIVAYSTVCTHMGCSVGESIDTERATAGPCPCHYTSFDLSKGGLTVVGPATTDLPQVVLDVEDGTIYATGVDGLVFGHRNNLEDGTLVTESDAESEEGSGDASGDGPVDGWLSDADNYDGTVVDRTDADEVTVTVGAEGNGGEFAYDPPAIRIASGTTVTFEWASPTHNVAVESTPSDAEWEGHDPIEDTGFTFSSTFETAGVYAYYCDPHLSLGMKGAIVVE